MEKYFSQIIAVSNGAQEHDRPLLTLEWIDGLYLTVYITESR